MALVATVLTATGCTAPDTLARQTGDPVARGSYLGVETELLDTDIVTLRVTMNSPDTPQAIVQYADCAAAGYALIRGMGFARHVRSNVSRANGIWTADAVYTVSEAIPRGTRTIDAEVVAANCKEMGIPTV